MHVRANPTPVANNHEARTYGVRRVSRKQSLDQESTRWFPAADLGVRCLIVMQVLNVLVFTDVCRRISS